MSSIPPLVKLYWLVWAAAFAVCLLVPATCADGSWAEAGALSAAYVLWSSVFAVLLGTLRLPRSAPAGRAAGPGPARGRAQLMLVLGTALVGCVGVAFL